MNEFDNFKSDKTGFEADDSGFKSDESGAVTVDWVVLTAAIIGMGMLVLSPVAYSTDNTAQAVGGHISGVQVGYQGN